MKDHAGGVPDGQEPQLQQRALDARVVRADVAFDHFGFMHLLGLFHRAAQEAAFDRVVAGDQFDDAHVAAGLIGHITDRAQGLLAVGGDQVAGFARLELRDALVEVQPAKDFGVGQAALFDLEQADHAGAGDGLDGEGQVEGVGADVGAHG